MIALEIMIVVIVLQRLSELVLSRRNYQWAIERGGIETGGGHYWMFFVLHAGWLSGIIIESLHVDGALSTYWYLAFTGFVVAQIIRYWAIASLGRQWNTRIIVVPDLAPVTTGPYRWLRHPNYIAVAIELACVPAMFGAWWTVAVASLANAAILLLIRIPAEERALIERKKPRQQD